MIEKLTRVGPKELLYQYTIEDPAIYSAPWLAEYSFYLSDKPLYEFGCHEGNYSLPNIMKGQRVRRLAPPGSSTRVYPAIRAARPQP